ncbi:uncharacterized protein [Nicotiana tomentosiformis]|uniref:uncharacterized protein n=1 Tax=Nicotiana tomentosiformis TaxID=4098 RepID=UPI00388CB4DE
MGSVFRDVLEIVHSQSLRDTWCIDFEQLCQGTMTVSEYALRFSELSIHAPALVPTVRERLRRFIKGLNYGIIFNMARELETDTQYPQVVEISWILEGIDWLLPYHTILECHAKTVTLAMPGLPRLEWRGTLDYVTRRIVSFLKAQWMVEKGCDTYLDFVRDFSVDTPTIESVPVV